jgi:hypothetical protein
MHATTQNGSVFLYKTESLALAAAMYLPPVMALLKLGKEGNA